MNHASLNRRDFLRIASASVVTSSILLPTLASAAASTTNVPQARLQRLSKGTNVTRWFRFPPRNDDNHFANYVSAADAEYMKQMGLSHVRLCVQPAIIMDPSTRGHPAGQGAFFGRRYRAFPKSRTLGCCRYPQ